MRAKDIFWIVSTLWMIFKGIQSYEKRMDSIDAKLKGQLIALKNMRIEMADINDSISDMRYPNPYNDRKRKRRGYEQDEPREP